MKEEIVLVIMKDQQKHIWIKHLILIDCVMEDVTDVKIIQNVKNV